MTLAISLTLKAAIPSLQDMRPNHRGFQGDPLSPSRIDFDRLTLVALEHVSMGSWQPHLRLI